MRPEDIESFILLLMLIIGVFLFGYVFYETTTYNPSKYHPRVRVNESVNVNESNMNTIPGSFRSLFFSDSVNDCPTNTSVVVLYLPSQKRLVTELFHLKTRFMGVTDVICGVEVNDSTKYRVLPMILLRSNKSIGIFNPVKEIGNGLYLSDPVIDAYVFTILGSRIGVYPVYNESSIAKIYYLSNYSRPIIDNQTIDRLKRYLSVLSASNVTRIVLEEGEIPGENYYPLVMFESNHDIGYLNQFLYKYRDNTYLPRNPKEGAALLLSIGATRYAEIVNVSIPSNLPHTGKGKYIIAVFEDPVCPYCYRFFKENLNSLLGLRDNYTIYIIGTPVHQTLYVYRIDRIQYCIWNTTKDFNKYIDSIMYTYHVLFETNKVINKYGYPDYQKLYQIVKDRYGEKNCISLPDFIQMSRDLMNKFLVIGTPTIVVGTDKHLVVHIGSMNITDIKKIVEDLEETETT